MTEVVVLPAVREPEALPTSEAEPAAITTSPRRAPTAREVVTVVATGLTVFGLLVAGYLVYLFGVSQLEHGRSQRALTQRFDGMLATQSASIGGHIDEGTPVAQLVIPAIGVRETVVEGSSGSLLRQGPGHLRHSPLPGQAGNVLIAGRASTYSGPFRDLGQLDVGDEIRIVTGQGTAKYAVTRTWHVSEGEDDVLNDAGDNRLTLMTSDGFIADDRLVTTATLRTTMFRTPAARPNEIRSSELGLHRDGSNAFALLVWMQLLLLASLVAVWLVRTQRRWPAYLVAVPVLLLLVLLVFDSVTPLLPSTL